MDSFYQTLVHVRIQVLSDERKPSWSTKWPPPISVHCCGHSNLVIFNPISFIFHIWFASIKFSFKFEYGFCPTTITKMADKVVAAYQYAFYHSHLLHVPDCFRISYMDYFYQTLTLFWIWALSDNQDGRQNGRHLSVCTCGHSNLVIYRLVSSKFHIWTTFMKLWLMSQYGFCPMNDNQDCRQNRYPPYTAGHYAGPFVWVWLF